MRLSQKLYHNSYSNIITFFLSILYKKKITRFGLAFLLLIISLNKFDYKNDILIVSKENRPFWDVFFFFQLYP